MSELSLSEGIIADAKSDLFYKTFDEIGTFLKIVDDDIISANPLDGTKYYWYDIDELDIDDKDNAIIKEYAEKYGYFSAVLNHLKSTHSKFTETLKDSYKIEIIDHNAKANENGDSSRTNYVVKIQDKYFYIPGFSDSESEEELFFEDTYEVRLEKRMVEVTDYIRIL